MASIGKEIKEKAMALVAAVCSHRVMYGGVAAAYGAGLAGLCDKALVEAVVVAAYAILAARG
jgi:hypothetical protein